MQRPKFFDGYKPQFHFQKRDVASPEAIVSPKVTVFHSAQPAMARTIKAVLSCDSGYLKVEIVDQNNVSCKVVPLIEEASLFEVSQIKEVTDILYNSIKNLKIESPNWVLINEYRFVSEVDHISVSKNAIICGVFVDSKIYHDMIGILCFYLENHIEVIDTRNIVYEITSMERHRDRRVNNIGEGIQSYLLALYVYYNSISNEGLVLQKDNTHQPLFDPKKLEILRNQVKKPISSVYSIQSYTLDLYAELDREKIYLIGVCIGEGNVALTIVDPQTLKPVAEFISRENSTVSTRELIHKIITDHAPRSIICIKRNGLGDPIISGLSYEHGIGGVCYHGSINMVSNNDCRYTLKEFLYLQESRDIIIDTNNEILSAQLV